jgi:ribosomal protein S13
MKDFKLDNEPKITSGFTTPEGYFDTFSDTVLAKLPAQHEVKVLSLSKSGKPWYYAVAAVAVLMLSVPVYNNFATNSDEIDSATLENYIAQNSSITQDQIVDLLDQEDLEKIQMELNVDDAAIEEALKSNSNLEEYILD